MFPTRNLGRFFRKTIQQPGYAAKVFVRRMRAQIAYSRNDGRSSFPEAVTLFLTHRCNLRCKMCGQWGESGVTKELGREEIVEELPFERLCQFIDEISREGTNVTLFGGEPLLYSRCLDLIGHIKKRGLHGLMITNGSLLGRYAQGLVEAGLDELNVSLDGGQALHDEIRGMPGLFEKITGGLKEVQRLKKEKGLKKPLVNLQCTITKYNCGHLEQLVEVAQQVGANSLTYHNLIFLGRDLIEKQKPMDQELGCSSHEWEGFVFSPGIDPEALQAKIDGIKKEKHPFSVDFYPNLTPRGLREYYRNPSYLPSGYPARCVSPWIVAYVFPNGEVRPCLNSSYSFGNIRREPFADIWNGPQARRYRNLLKRSKIFPVCVRCTELYRY